MKKTELQAIKRRLRAATKWTPKDCGVPEREEDGYQPCPDECETLGNTLIQFAGSYEGGGEDWLFLAHAQQDMQALIKEVERERDELCPKLDSRTPASPLDVSMDAYQKEALRTAAHDGLTPEVMLATRALGLTGEAGEVADLIKKHLGHGHPLDREKVKKEIGDVLWYCATLADAVGFTLSEVADANVAKLRARYPAGFDQQRSMKRAEGDS